MSGFGAFGAMRADEMAAMFEAERTSLRLVAAAIAGRGDAEDVLQESFLVCARKRAGYREGSDFRAWAAAVVRRVALNHRRGRRRAAQRERVREAPMSVSTEMLPDAPVLEAALSTLSDEQRACVLLRVVRGLSFSEVALTLGIAEATARSHVHRARGRLRDALLERGVEISGGAR